jgi:hypothetical protein
LLEQLSPSRLAKKYEEEAKARRVRLHKVILNTGRTGCHSCRCKGGGHFRTTVIKCVFEKMFPASSLPSLMMPCTFCAGRMVYNTKRPCSSELEDTVYTGSSCGAELIRTSLRQAPRA